MKREEQLFKCFAHIFEYSQKASDAQFVCLELADLLLDDFVTYSKAVKYISALAADRIR